MKKFIQIFGLLCLFIPSLSQAESSLGLIAPPPTQPPANNPHPPVTEQDKKRVAFAERLLIQMLKRPLPELKGNKPGSALPAVDDSKARLNLDDACIQSDACWSAQPEVRIHVERVQTSLGILQEYRHLHIIPWAMEKFELKKAPNTGAMNPNLKKRMPKSGQDVAHSDHESMSPTNLQPDEFIFHAYGRFDKYSQWYHIDVIVTEDAAGNLRFQRFFIIPLPQQYQDLPPGVVC